MKKKIITLAAAFVLIANVMFANTGKSSVPEFVVSAFYQTFSHAREVSWENFGNYFKATFWKKGKTIYAFYSENGDFIGVAKNVLSDRLPEVLRTEIKSKFQGYWISDLSEYHVNDSNGFVITLENADKKIVLKAENSQHWQLYTQGVKG
jgi:hypothetical protein